ncbi:MAG: hypothetical protein ACREC0_00520 [Methylocella sp.]
MTGFFQTAGARVHLRLVDGRAHPPRQRRLDVRITVRDGHEPFGRSRGFRISDHDLDELIATAARMEARR